MEALATKRPNLLFIVTDQHRADHTGFGGNATVRTPNLDSIAARGMVFDRAYVANPVCAPNRSTMITGRYPTAHGVIFNDRSLPVGVNTWPQVFRRAGYRTGLFGKADLMLWRGVRVLDHGPGDPAVFDPYPPGWDRYETASSYVHELPEPPADFYGFETAEFAIGHGAIVGGHHLRWALERGIDPTTIAGATLIDGPAEYRSERWSQVLKPSYDAEFHSTSFVTDRTVDFVERGATSDEPWVAYASFPDPHHPFAPPGEWFDRHRAEDMALPESFHDDLADAPLFMRDIADRPGEPAMLTPWRPTEDQFREALAAQYGAIEMIDDGIGQMLAALDATGQRDDTIVVFTSDHGDMMGDHGLLLKGMQHWEGTTRVPLVIDAPDQAPGRTSALASSVDLAQTIIDLAGLAPYRDMQGVSLMPVVADPSRSVRDHVLVEEHIPEFVGFSGLAGDLPTTARSLITATTRFTRYSTGETQLFDLGNDRAEMRDLSDREPALVTEMSARMIDTMMSVALPAPMGPAPEPVPG